jgi:Holliday junction resolvasome RuvABC endonuclease subunit
MIAKIIKINNSRPETICAIDASTNSLAFAVYDQDNLKEFGKINFDGKDIYQKVGDAAIKTRAYFKDFMKADAIVIEHTVFMNSPKTAADLALVQGALLGAAAMSGITTVGKVSPITWQNYMGNKKISKDEQLYIRSQNPGKSQSWYKAFERNLRKERTIKFINTIYDKAISDNDVADACGIGHWAIKNWDKAVGVDK